jgi:hypothetical protein
MKIAWGLCAVLLTLASSKTEAQVKIDVSSKDVKQALGKIYLDDLSINDTALIYPGFCVKDQSLYIKGWVEPANLSTNQNYEGVVLRVEVMPGKTLKATYVDATQAQKVAKGNPVASSHLSKEDYNSAVLSHIDAIFSGGFFSEATHCDYVQQVNPLRPLNLFAVQSINGYTKLSDLLASLTPSKAKP